MALLIFFLIIVVFIIYLLIDLARTNPNAFFDKWLKKSVWIWLPFYALRRLIREMFFDKK